ncbi:MAG: response regulator [Candidatus Rokubacteria bacterium]|nr:response regulator [Candidatus Rokubacteria bacterium]
MRVLVVEDEQDVGDVFLDYLVELGHQPLLVRTAEAALGKLVTERPDAIIVDVNLPGMSGIEFLQLRPIRESGVPVVAVSGVATESQARECLRLGAIDFVGKPLPFKRLQEVLTYLEPHALDRRRGADEARQDRRHFSRAPLTVPVRVVEYGGGEWQATSVDVSVGGIRLSGRAATRTGSAARLTFALPDGGTMMTVMALLVRADIGGFAFSFVNLTGNESDRLRQLVDRFV